MILFEEININIISEDVIAQINYEFVGSKRINDDRYKSCMSSFYYYDSDEEQIASIVLSLVKGHYFMDGNKRTAFSVFVILCKFNNIKISKTERQIYKNDFDNALKELETYFAKMSPNTHYPMDAVFKRHKIANAEMRNAIDKTLAVADPNSYHTELNNKNILIIDDIISRGASIRESIKIIKQTYTPKSITILTLLSKL